MPWVKRPPRDGARKRRSTVSSLPVCPAADCANSDTAKMLAMSKLPILAREKRDMHASLKKRVILYLTCGLRNGLGAEFLNLRLVGALRRGNPSDRRGFDLVLASLHKRADGDGECESQQGTIAEQRQGSQAFARAKASAINFQARHVGAHHHGEECPKEQRGYQR